MSGGAARQAGGRASSVRMLAAVALPVLAVDLLTKALAVARLQPPYAPHRLVGDVVRLTLAYNQEGVMGLPAGPDSRWILSAVSAVLLVVLARLLFATRPGDRPRAAALALIIGGAVGNLADRLVSARGVVDFIDIGTPAWRFWTFNVADIGIDVGIVLLGWALWRADLERKRSHAITLDAARNPR